MKFLDALNRKNKGSPPVWLMRQAGRYMPEYRAIRERHSFLEMCHTPELVVEITQQPLKAFGMDAAIIFSDILIVAEALGVGLRFEDSVGPIIERPVRNRNDIASLNKKNITERTDFLSQSIRLLLPEISVPLIGFAGAPFTVASYMIEGKSTKDFALTKQWMFQDPEGFHELLDVIADATIEYLDMQVKAGVHAIQLFDSWANALAPAQFVEFSLGYMNKIMKKVKVPVILFCRGSSTFASMMAQLKPAAISVDWNGSLPEIRKKIGAGITLQGNLDPDVLLAPAATIRNEVNELLSSMAGDPAYIFNLGHGVTPRYSPDAVKILVDTVHESCLANIA